MGLLSALGIAVSGLNANQQNLNILSQNIANANTPNYSNEVANQQSAFISGQPEGVTIASVTREVNQFLNSEVQAQTSTNGSASAVQNYYGEIENLLGQPGANNSIDTTITSFFTSLQNLANAPSVSAETTAVNAGQAVATQISGLANSLQGLRYQSDQDIGSAVTNVNTDLKNLYSINNAIEQATATNQSTAGLLDQRDAAIADIAQYIDIKPTYQNDGEVSLATTNGVTLLSQSLTQLNYQGATGEQTFVNNGTLSPITVTTLDSNGNPIGQPVTLATGGVPSSITTSLVGGSIQGLLSMRDTVIPNILSQLDELASTLRDQVNAVQNAGVSYPPPNSYTGERPVTASTTSTYSGSIQIAVLDANGNPVASPYADEPNGAQPVTINLGQLNYGQGAGVLSVGDIISAINQQLGTPQSKLELGNLNNVQLAVASNNVPDTGNTLNFGFNLNNISSGSDAFTVTGAQIYADPAMTISAGAVTGGFSTTVASGQTLNTNTAGNTLTANLNSAGLAATTLTVVADIQTMVNGSPVTSTVSYQIPNNTSNTANNLIGVSNIVSGSGSIVAPQTTQPLAVASLVDANGNPITDLNGLNANTQGYLKITAGNSSNTIAISSLDSQQLGMPGATPPVAGSDQGFSQYFGLNNFFNMNSPTVSGDTLANSALNLSVTSNILNNPGAISTASLALGNQPTAAGATPNFTYQVSSGDNSNSQALAGLATSILSFPPSGSMPASGTTLSQYAGQIIALTSSNSTQATNTATNSQTLLTGFTQRAQTVSGVNLDQELANTVIYQNAYTASTRVITVVGTLFTELLGIIQ